MGCQKLSEYFCPDCQKRIQAIQDLICPVCQRFSVSGQTHFKCQSEFSLNGLLSLFAYQGPIKEAIKKLKYQFVTDLAEELVELALKTIRKEQKVVWKQLKRGVLVPVPLHPRRQRQRGFNQAELLGKVLAEKLSWSVETDFLIRQKHTPSQASLKSRDRQENIKGAFKIRPYSEPKIQNSKLILFDDVWTTGSTLKEAASVLKKNGARQVWGLTLAR